MSFTYRGILTLVALTVLTASAKSSSPLRLIDQPLPTEFTRKSFRAIYLDLINSSDPQPLQTLNPPPAGSKQGALLDHYRKNIEPRMLLLAKLRPESRGLRLLLDSGLFDSPEEMNTWKKRLDEISAIYAKLSIDETWTRNVLEFGRLAEGMVGQMAVSARRSAQEVELEQFPPAYRDEVKELYTLYNEISLIASRLDANTGSIKTEAELNRTLNAYHSMTLSFREAAKRIEELTPMHQTAVGQELVQKAGDQLQRLAVVRSILAKSKGFKNWADYMLTVQGLDYGVKLRSSDQLLPLLNALIKRTQATAARWLHFRAAQQGLRLSSLRPAQLTLLDPAANYRLYGYIQKENIETIWRNTMHESGFTEEQTRRVMVDAFPRTNKQANAYMSPARAWQMRTMAIDGQTLNYQFWPQESTSWEKPVTVIVQNFKDDSYSDLRTMHHEGGHALDYAEFVDLSQAESLDEFMPYGRTETPSGQNERFLEEFDYLKSIAFNRQNQAAGEERIQLFIRENKINRLHQARSQAAFARLDIELWSVDYSQPNAPKLWDRARDLGIQMHESIYGIRLPDNLREVRGYRYFSSPHFWGGSVRYYGYILAFMGAELVHKKVLDQLEQDTGRRSVYKQPGYAPLIRKFYRDSRRTTFPESIEQFTGTDFSPEAYTLALTSEVDRALDEMKEPQIMPPNFDQKKTQGHANSTQSHVPFLTN